MYFYGVISIGSMPMLRVGQSTHYPHRDHNCEQSLLRKKKASEVYIFVELDSGMDRRDLEDMDREAQEWTPVSTPVTGEAAFLQDVGAQEVVAPACLPDAEEQPAPQGQKRQRLSE